MKRSLTVIAALFLLVGSVLLVPTFFFTPWKIEHFYTRVLLEELFESPELLSSLRLLEPMGIDFHSDDLDDYSMEPVYRGRDRIERSLKILRSYDTEGMSAAEKLSRDIMEDFITSMKEGMDEWLYHGYVISQLNSIHTSLPDFMVNTHQINDQGDAEDYLERVSKIAKALDQTCEVARLFKTKGVVAPDFILKKARADVEKFHTQPATDNALYVSFDERIRGLEDIDDSEKDTMRKTLVRHITESVYPAYRRYRDTIDELATVATSEAGVWKLPRGLEYYGYALRASTTSSMSPDEVHQLGLQKVDELQAEMRAILEAEGYEVESIGTSMDALGKEERFLYPDSDEGRAQMLADYTKLIEDFETKLEPIFDIRPSSKVVLKRVPEFQEETAPFAYYQPPPLDGSAPGTFFANLKSIGESPKFDMATLVAHEAIPGHHFQIGLAQEQTHLPMFRTLIPYNAYAEGWALYAERVSVEHGLIQDPYDRLGFLRAQLFRAVRLVVDTGLHAKRWTRQQSIDYMREMTGMALSEVEPEIDRYIVIPGQACGYMLGQLTILKLRDRAREALGERFDIRRFHNFVLTGGAMPLNILERDFERWLAEESR